MQQQEILSAPQFSHCSTVQRFVVTAMNAQRQPGESLDYIPKCIDRKALGSNLSREKVGWQNFVQLFGSSGYSLWPSCVHLGRSHKARCVQHAPAEAGHMTHSSASRPASVYGS
jgi:hypothetical protein